MANEFDASEYSAPGTVATTDSVLALPNLSGPQQTTTNLAAGASVDFDFNMDYNPILDMFVFCDIALIVRVFVRQSSSDTYRQLGADSNVVAATMTNVLAALRVPGSQARVRILNNTAGASATLSAQVHARSM